MATIFTTESIKPELRGDYGIIFCRDADKIYYSFIGAPHCPINERCKQLDGWGLKIERVYDGIKSKLAFDLAEKGIRDLNNEYTDVEGLDDIVLLK